MSLKIAFIGHNADFTKKAFADFVQANREEICCHSFRDRPFAIFLDNTEVFAIPPYRQSLVGKRFDQVILADSSVDGFLTHVFVHELSVRLTGQVPQDYLFLNY